MVKSIELFRKIGPTRGTHHAKLGTIKNSKVKDLPEADEIKRGGKNAKMNCTKMVINSG